MCCSRPLLRRAHSTVSRKMAAYTKNLVRWMQIAGLLVLVLLAFQNYRYRSTVRMNRQSLIEEQQQHGLSYGGLANSPWQRKNVTIWTVWFGDEDPPPVIQAAMQTCRDVHKDEPFLHYRVLTNKDLHDGNLEFPLHSSFWLLDSVEQSDYLRAELMHYYGGFYMDADIICLKSFRRTLVGHFDAAAAQDTSKYGAWPSVSQNALGPFKPKSDITTEWHDGLHRTMDELTPRLLQCLGDNVSIPYPKSRRYGTSMCGVPWGGVIDFVKPVWIKNAKAGLLGHDLSICSVKGRHLGWDGSDRSCDLVHLGTAGPFYKKKDWTINKLCKELPVMQGSQHCR